MVTECLFGMVVHPRGDTLFVYNEDLDESNHKLKFTVPSGHGIKAGDIVNISGLTFTSNDAVVNGGPDS